GLIVAFVLLGGFTLLASLALLAAAGRWWRPVAWWRLASWSLSFLFHGGGLIAVSALASHHPDDFDDPARLSVWLDDYDAERRTLAPWPAHRARR
ncbi:MAG: hypothetical protein OEY23_05165, partial [Acidimicrobiia bacterium]|nr:hypothetical protein [Acidimicrobiia bacterium]